MSNYLSCKAFRTKTIQLRTRPEFFTYSRDKINEYVFFSLADQFLL